jgi:translocation and assembly module TamB
MRRALILLAGLVVAVPLALWAALQTSLPATLAARFVPGLHIEGLSPGLPSHFSASRLTYADAQGVWLTIERPELRLALSGLLRGRLVATRLAADSVTVARWPSDEGGGAGGGSGLPRLPLAVELRELALPRIILPEAQLAATGRATLEAGALDTRLALRQLDGAARLDLDARFDGAHLAATLEAEEPAGTLLGAPLSLRLALDGPAAGAAWQLAAQYGEARAELAGTASRAAGATTLASEGALQLGDLLPENIRPLLEGAKLALALRVADDGRLTLLPTAWTRPSARRACRARRCPPSPSTWRWTSRRASASPPCCHPASPGRRSRRQGRVSGAPARPLVEARVTPQGLATGIALADAALGPNPALTLRLTPDLADSRVTLEGPALSLTLAGDLGETLDAQGELRLAATPPGASPLPAPRDRPHPWGASRAAPPSPSPCAGRAPTRP